MLVLATSSAKPESLNTTRVSTAGASSLCQVDNAGGDGFRHLSVEALGQANDQGARAN